MNSKTTFLTAAVLLILSLNGISQTVGPDIYSWILNTSNYTGFNGIEADCQRVQYSTNFTYVDASGVPAYNIGPWGGNPNTASDQNWVFKIPRNPVENTGNKIATGLGQIAVLVNGASIFNAEDAFSYNNQGIWHQDANVFEGQGFDATGGHPAPGGVYHYHTAPVELYANSAAQHSPIIGFSFDGFPIYGPFGYSNPNDANSSITRILSSFQLRNITVRQILPDGSNLQPNQYGPTVGGQYPLGAYVEDYEYVNASGDLDQYNGRECITPEYPTGTYAYFLTTDANNEGAYPYFIGPEYYGILEMANVGPGGGHANVTEPTTDWNGVTAIADNVEKGNIALYPNPVAGQAILKLENMGDAVVTILNVQGQVLMNYELSQSMAELGMDLHNLPAGMYFLRVRTTKQQGTLSFLKQ